MNKTILVIDDKCNVKEITEVEFNNYILPFGWAKNYQEYLQLRKKGLYNHYIWKWSKNKETPKNWLMATPVKIFGYVIGWKVELVKTGYENVFFTSNKTKS